MAEFTKLSAGMARKANSRLRSQFVGRDPMWAFFAYRYRFKPDKEGELIQYTGLSQSAIREMALCSELSHAGD